MASSNNECPTIERGPAQKPIRTTSRMLKANRGPGVTEPESPIPKLVTKITNSESGGATYSDLGWRPIRS